MTPADTTDYKRWLHSPRWKATRAAFLAAHPYCEDCEARRRRTAATEVHHAVPVLSVPQAKREGLMFAAANLRALCRDCHLQRHRRKEQRKREAERKADKLNQFLKNGK